MHKAHVIDMIDQNRRLFSPRRPLEDKDQKRERERERERESTLFWVVVYMSKKRKKQQQQVAAAGCDRLKKKRPGISPSTDRPTDRRRDGT